MINNSDEITQLTNQSDWDKQKIKSRDLNLYAVDIGSGCVFEFIKYEKHYKILDEGILEENFQINEELKYEKILPEFFPWKNHMKENLSVEQLPIKLYNIKTKKVEEVNDLSKVKSYATLSYIWGDRDENGFLKKVSVEDREITISANKALDKATKALELINIDKNKELLKENSDLSQGDLQSSDIIHLWIDQLCVNQADLGEKSREVPKMSKYYSNSSVTLIAMGISIEIDVIEKLETAFIDDGLDLVSSVYNGIEDSWTNDLIEEALSPIFKIIFRSRWFSRSWTFQEGWLSKQTIFMFDNCLVDGRFLATTLAMKSRLLGYHGCFVGMLSGDLPSRKSLIINNIKSVNKKFATHIGWTYFHNGYSIEDRLTLNLGTALFGIKNRERTESIDGLYSILGLLPYGSSVSVDYKIQPWEALCNIMKTALENGYGEPLGWYGESSTLPNLSWIPQVYPDGSTSVQGGETVKYKFSKLNSLINTEKGLRIKGKEFNVTFLTGGGGGCSDLFYFSSTYEVECEGSDKLSLTMENRINTSSQSSKSDVIIKSGTILVPNNDWSGGAIWVLKGKGNIRHRLGKIFYNSISGTALEKVIEKEFIISSAIESIEVDQTIETERNELFASIEKKIKSKWFSIKNKKRVEILNSLLNKVADDQSEQQSREWSELTKIARRHCHFNFTTDLTKLCQLQLRLKQLELTETGSSLDELTTTIEQLEVAQNYNK